MYHKLCLRKAFDVSRFWNIYYHDTLWNVWWVWLCKMLLPNDISKLLAIMITWDNSFQYQNICVITHKNRREDFRQLTLFLFVWTASFGRSFRLWKLFSWGGEDSTFIRRVCASEVVNLSPCSGVGKSKKDTLLWSYRSFLVLHCIALYCLYCIVLYCIVLYCIVLYCIVFYFIVLYCTVLYCTVLEIPGK